MNYYLFIPFVIILLFFIPVRLEGRISFNLLERSGAFGIFVFGIKVDHEQFWVEHKKIITKKENSIEKHELNTKSKDYLFSKFFIFEIKDKTKLKEFFVFYNLGVNDAFESAMLGGLFNALLLILMAKVKNEKPTASTGVYDTISFNQQVCQLSTRGLMTISLFDVVYSFIRSVILTKKELSKIELESGGKK